MTTTETFQQDIYQRYSLLNLLLVAAFPPPQDGSVISILDIGSGPERLTERFLPDYFSVTRADVDTFGDDAVVRLEPGRLLPFAEGSFAAVLALEVLEHVPEGQRASLIHDCARVSSSVVVLCCPVAAALTARAEDIFQSLAAEISGSPIAFLDEHKAVGLPDAGAIRTALEARMSHVFDVPNSPLPEWLVYNLIDLAYACDFGDAEEKANFNARVNATTPLALNGPHYRRFFVGCTDAQTLERVAQAAPDALRQSGDAFTTAVRVSEALVHFRGDLLRKQADGLREALRAKDAHIQALDEVIARLQEDIRHQAGRVEGAAPHPPEPNRLGTRLQDARARLRTLRLGRRVAKDVTALVAGSGLFDVDFYRAQNPDVVASGIDPIVHYLALGGAEGRAPNALFDAAYYLAQSPDVRASALNPLAHYLTHGAVEGRDPHPLFDTAFYLAHHPEVAQSGMTPLAHYLVHGARLRWDPNPMFWSGYYLDTNPDVRDAGVNPLAHYVLSGAAEGRSPNPLFNAAYYRALHADVLPPGADALLHYIRQGVADSRDPHPLFDTAFYLARHPEVAESGTSPLAHYLLHGARLRWDPSPTFWTGYYLDANPDVRAAGMNPLAHYALIGAKEGRNPNPLFDGAYYLARNADVAAAAVDPLLHYLAEGAAEGRDPHRLFWTRYYLETNADVAAAGVNPLVHYILHGAAEGRNPNPLFDAAWYLASNADIAAPGSNPLVHYLAEGAAARRDPHPLFDTSFYLSRHPEVADDEAGALAHYLSTGAETGWDPHPLFWSAYYLEQNRDVAAAGANPLVHYVLYGAAEGRSPNPFFDGGYYLARNPDVAAKGLNPLVHYLQAGAAEGRKTSALFDTSHYVSQNPDVAAAGVNPLAHYIAAGRGERRSPNRLFDPVYYLSVNRDVEAAGADPLLHFVNHGAAEGRDPSASFDTSYYLSQNPDVADAGLNPLAHYLDYGVVEGRRALPPDTSIPVGGTRRFVPPPGLLPWFNPLNLRIAPSLDDIPSLNVLVPGLGMQHMSGGPNTALHIAYRLAIEGVRVRFVSTDAPLGDREALWAHVQQLAGSDRRLPHVEFADGHDRRQPLAIGRNDLFFATAWWTAQMARYGSDLTRSRTFIYLIQDYEPLFHAASTPQALAIETYALDYVPVVNSRVLFDFLSRNGVGRFASPAFADKALVFEAAVDRSRFFVEPPMPGRRRRLLFYARPTTGLRNLFELGVAALMDAVERGVFGDEPWDILAMGEAVSPIDLGSGVTLTPAPWLDFDGYAAQMRQSDVLLSLMLSPHTSYPPIEMAACGGLVVTNAFDCKTAERLATISSNIIGADATLEGIAAAIGTAVRRFDDHEGRQRGASLDLPPAWADSLAPIVDGLLPLLLSGLGVTPSPAIAPDDARVPARLPRGFDAWPRSRYEVYRINRLRERRSLYLAAQPPGLFSFVTPVWNTDAAMLECLADSLLSQQDAHAFEWVILDNGSDRAETLEVLERISRHPVVRLHRAPHNGGIVQGLRSCLELARNRYVVFVDHDDFVAPDCVRVLASALEEHGYPPLFYTDEEKLHDSGHYDTAYFKPDWDPVLFVSSCFIAHLCGVDRALALALSCCDDPGSEGSHDWDTFMRFVLAGHTPHHVPDVLYTWRAHQGSTGGNIQSKPYVFDSQQNVLSKFLRAQPQASRFRLEKSPLFGGSPDWWIRRTEANPRPITTVVWSAGEKAPVPGGITIDRAIPHEITAVGGAAALSALGAIARACAGTGRLIHLLWEAVDLDGPEWAWEAMGLLELFPDTVMVGGRLHDGRQILTAGQMFGFGLGCDSPDRGRQLHDPGYFAQMWKPHSVSAVSAQHAVVDAQFLAGALDELDGLDGLPASMAHLGAWLGGIARRAGARVVYSPFFSGHAQRDADLEISPRERGVFRVVNADLIPETHLLSPRLGLSRGTAYLPVAEEIRRTELEPDSSVLLDYPDWLTARIAARRRLYPLATRVPSLSVLTTVYSGTPAALFEATADSLLRQTHAFSEWIILAHGSISAELDAALTGLERAPGVRVFRRPDNLGIVGGMRECLRAAESEYVVPVDGDDLLTVDALQILASAIGRRESAPLLVYSDEDVWRGEGPESPYVRPDFDPVLNMETSYVWHVCAIRRDAALAHGVYSDPAVEYCHDWDSITRTAAVEDPVHVPEVIYHWRHHAVSHTNRGGQHPGSLASTRTLLERRMAGLPNSSMFEVAEFPIFRGQHEWYIRRKRVEPPPIGVMVKAVDRSSARIARDRLVGSGFPFVRVATVESEDEAVAALRSLAASGSTRYVAVVSALVTPEGDDWIWEAVRLFECHSSLALCGGRLIDGQGEVARACGVLDMDGALVHPFVGLGRLDPGPFAFALKPHLVATVPDELYVIATDMLSAGACVDSAAADRSSGLRLAADAWARGRTVAYSPLIEARIHDAGSPRRSDEEEDCDRETLAHLRATLAGRRLGAAGFFSLRGQYRS